MFVYNLSDFSNRTGRIIIHVNVCNHILEPISLLTFYIALSCCLSVFYIIQLCYFRHLILGVCIYMNKCIA